MMAHPEFPADQDRYPEASQATTAVTLGILGIFFTILAPVALWLASRELEAIDSGRRSPDNRGTAKTARVLGIIGTSLLGLELLLSILLFTLYPEIFSIG